MKESLLISQCQQGIPAAQRQLYNQYYNYVYTIALRYLQNHHDCEDVVSEVFIRVFKNIGKVNKTSNQGLKRWIQVISINESLRFLKKRLPIEYTADDTMLDMKVEATTVSMEEIDDSAIKKIINEMPPGYRMIFLMNVVEGLSHSEIAEHLDISRNTSKSQMLRARKYLQLKLSQETSRKYG